MRFLMRMMDSVATYIQLMYFHRTVFQLYPDHFSHMLHQAYEYFHFARLYPPQTGP